MPRKKCLLSRGDWQKALSEIAHRGRMEWFTAAKFPFHTATKRYFLAMTQSVALCLAVQMQQVSEGMASTEATPLLNAVGALSEMGEAESGVGHYRTVRTSHFAVLQFRTNLSPLLGRKGT